MARAHKWRMQRAEGGAGTLFVVTDKGSFRIVGAGSNDADLLELGPKFETAQKRFVAKSNANKPTDDAISEAHKIALAILNKAANTLAGAQLKQRVIEFLDPAGVEAGWWKTAAKSLERDLVRLLKKISPLTERPSLTSKRKQVNR